MANRVKFEFLDNLKKSEEQLLASIQIVCSSLVPTDCHIERTFGLVTFCNPENVPQLFTEEIKEELRKCHLLPKPPNSYYTDRTIWAANIKSFVASKSGKDLVTEFNSNNKDYKADTIVVVNTHNEVRFKLKIIMSSKEQAERVSITGFKIGGMLVESHNIQKEKVDNVSQCFRCFSFEHVVNQCQRDHPLCSICAEEHNFRECPNKNDKSKTKCVNCRGQHIAIAKSCPKRKEKINEKENKEPQTNLPNQQQQKRPSNPLSQDNFPALNSVNIPSSQPPQQHTAMAWANTNNQNSNVTTIHSQQQQPISTTQSCNTDEYKKHEWEIKLSIAKSCAEMAAKGNASRFLVIMNSFLKDIGLSPLNMDLNPHTEATCSNREQNRNSQSSPINQLPSLTPISPLFGRTPLQSPNPFSYTSSQTNTSVNTSTPTTHNVTVIERRQTRSNSSPELNNSNSQDQFSPVSSASQITEKTNNTSINSQSPSSHNTTRDSSINEDTSTDLFHNTNTKSTHSSQPCTYIDPKTSLSHQITVTEIDSEHPTIHIPSPQTQDSLNLRLTDTTTRDTTSDCASDLDTEIEGKRKLRKKPKYQRTHSRGTQ